VANDKADYLRDNEKKFASEMAAKRGVTAADSGDKNRGTPKGNYADKEIKKGGK
jgi:hypothetical protein